MFLQSNQVMKRIDPVESACMNETHKQIPDESAVLGPKEQRIFAMLYRPFQNLFAERIVQWRSGDP